MRYILAHDLETSGNKATLSSETGIQVACATVGYPSRFFNGAWAEQDSDDSRRFNAYWDEQWHCYC